VKLVADEGVDRPIVERLRADGHSVWYVAEMSPGIADDAVLELANREDALLLTGDKDFGELVFRQRHVTAGVILLRIAGLSMERKAMIVSAEVGSHAAKLPKAFTVISPGGVRIRCEIS
jgi:predicted nuclease of predicted toxin-antitoxin system